MRGATVYGLRQPWNSSPAFNNSTTARHPWQCSTHTNKKRRSPTCSAQTQSVPRQKHGMMVLPHLITHTILSVTLLHAFRSLHIPFASSRPILLLSSALVLKLKGEMPKMDKWLQVESVTTFWRMSGVKKPAHFPSVGDYTTLPFHPSVLKTNKTPDEWGKVTSLVK